nr:MAG TPA: hypothetical protein [Caudoviricetes sp.]
MNTSKLFFLQAFINFLFPSKEIIFSLYSLVFTLPFIRA